MNPKTDTRVGCAPSKFGERVPEEFLNHRGTAVNTPAVSAALRPDMPHFGSPEDVARDVGEDASTVRRLIACGSLETADLQLAKWRLKFNVTSAQAVVAQHRVEAAQRAKEGRERGWLVNGRPTAVGGGSLSK